MNELLKKLLDSELLTEDSKAQIEAAFQQQLAELESTTKLEVEQQVRVELTEQWVKTKEDLVNGLDEQISEMFVNEIAELKNDIENYKDLEIESAKKLAKTKKKLKEEMDASFTELVDHLNEFLEERIAHEFEEIKEDLNEAKKLEFGRQIFEAFAPEYRKHFVDGNDTERELHEAKIAIDRLKKKYKNVKGEKEELFHKIKLESVLTPLSGTKRDVMEAMLANVATDKLEESYSKYIGRVVKESSNTNSTTKSLNESSNKFDFDPRLSHLITGDIDDFEVQRNSTHQVTESTDLTRFRTLAGL
jgi:hypothetical protein